MRKKWENPVVNVLGIKDTTVDFYRGYCLGLVDIKTGGQITPCNHPDKDTDFYNGEILNDNNDEYTIWRDKHVLYCGNNEVFNIHLYNAIS